MRHHLDTVIASDLSYRVFQRRRELGELHTGALDRNHQLFNVPSLIANRRRFIPDVVEFGDSANPNAPVRVDMEPVPTWHFRGKR
jgi:hypothetical protein